jgi:hypothetical protein
MLAALEWLKVAASAIERAEACRAKSMQVRDEAYEFAAWALSDRIRQDNYALQLEAVILARLDRERGTTCGQPSTVRALRT